MRRFSPLHIRESTSRGDISSRAELMSLPLLAPLLLSLVPTAHLPSGAMSARAFAQGPRRLTPPAMQWFGGGGGGGGAGNARDLDFQRRQEKLANRKAAASAQPKGQVIVTFPQKGNKQVTAKQGEPVGAVCKRAGVRVKFDCKNGRCATCQVRLNGRAALKVCQGGKIPGGATKKLTITLDNP